MMKCPECGAADVQVLGKRNYPYPVAFLVILSTSLAMLHQAASPIDYRCPACRLRFSRRTSTGCVALLLMVSLVGGILLLLFLFSFRGIPA